MTKSKDEFLSMQHIFDKAAVGMLRQKQQSMNAAGDACVYRAPDGCKCAVGFLIEDEHYDAFFEGPAIGSAGINADQRKKIHLLKKALRNSKVNTLDPKVLGLLEELQYVHDDFMEHSWSAELNRVAEQFDLSTKSIDRCIKERNHGKEEAQYPTR